MNLRDRLERLRRLGLMDGTQGARGPVGPEAGDAAAAGPQRQPPGGPPPHAVRAVAALNLQGRPTPLGDAYAAEEQVPAAEPWGAVTVERLRALPLEPLLRFAGLEGTHADAERVVFLDTETTGLAGGTGTLVVVVGVGRLAGDGLHIRQLVLVDPAGEDALLEALAEELDGARLLVSFNGRSFDWPLLESRFVLNRMRARVPALPHLDLLHPARRLYGLDLESCRLAVLERDVLGADRGVDIPGSEVPLRYRMLLDGHPDPFADVLRHNRLDVRSLVALTCHVADLADGGLARPDPPDHAGPAQLLALARACLAHAQVDRAERLLVRALEAAAAPRRGAAWFRIARTLADLYRRLGRWSEAAALWQAVADTYPAAEVWALTELAKEREHRARDLVAALSLTERALEACRRRLLLGSATARRDLQELEHRRSRLLRRLGRHNPTG